jgi:uncharacterized protein YhjY with autotransporter beta-barrel domain
MKSSFVFGALIVAGACTLLSGRAQADLTDPEILTPLNPLEELAAQANQTAFNLITADPDGPNGPLTPVCDPDQRVAAGACTGNVFAAFENIRELVHTSNELVGNGPTTFSLGLDIEGLGFALRWTAAEELAAQGSTATEFSNSQLHSLASRISALRFGARGFRTVANRSGSDTRVVRAENAPLGGGAAADTDSIAKRWGGFIDGSFGYGRKDDTTFASAFEDAFDYDGQEVTVGLDYRLTDNFVLGAIGGYSEKEVDFDSTASIVDGGIKSEGESFIAYALWESERFFVSGSVGGQWLNHELTRRIVYPSLNPLVESVDFTAHSDSDSTSVLATFGAGFDARWGAFGLGPYVKGDYQDITIDGFSEATAGGFELTYGDQDIKSFDTALGVRLQYVLLPKFGVIVPYLRGEYHKQLEDDPRAINSVYEGLTAQAGFGSTNFAIPTDERDDEYYVVSGGFSVVLKNGLQGFIQYQEVLELDTITDSVITGGFRMEF